MKPNLFIVGAMKAGTTSFTEILSQHPQIYMSPIKEPHFFVKSLPKNLYEPSRFFNLQNYFENDFPISHHIAKIESEIHYKKLFSLAKKTHKCIAEASTAYLHAPESANLIKKFNPDAKIIIIVRNPLQRAFSQYKMDLGLGRVTKSFDELINKEITLYRNGKLPWNSYIGMSFYKKATKRYRLLFKDVLLIDFDDLICEREKVMEEVSVFLKIDCFTSLEVTNSNISKKIYFQKLFYFLKRLGLKDYFSKMFPTSFKQKLFNLLSSEKKQTYNLSNQTKETIQKLFINESPDL